MVASVISILSECGWLQRGNRQPSAWCDILTRDSNHWQNRYFVTVQSMVAMSTERNPKEIGFFWSWHFLTSNLIGFWDGGVGREAPFSWKGLGEVRREPKTRSVSPFLKPPPFRIRLDMSDHAGRQRQAQTGVTAGQLTWDFCGQRHRARRNMMCTDNLQCSCRIEHQWRSGGLWLDTAKYEIFTKVHLTKTHLNKTRWQSRQRWSPSPIREPTCTITGLWVSVWCALVCKLCNV